MFESLDLAALLPFIGIGVAAQLVDGALGMAFGVISSTLLVSVMGVPPATASAGVHLVECFTTGISGISHALHRNVNWRLFLRLAMPGVIGGILGAYVLTSLDAAVTRPFVMGYLALIGVYLLIRAIRFPPKHRQPKIVEPLGLAGGFLDAAGGGGWGPVVTSNLLVQGAPPRETIGTVNTSEFVLTMSISAAFLIQIGTEGFSAGFLNPVLGLLIGGIIAAPFGAFFARRVPARALLIIVGAVLTLTSAFSLWKALT
ncbi:sulfite exporter TauE/SafE family protein [Stakelama tenebrarum]|uniref:Probable membrane transporter protein n=1 Tax=Stakelama tenebrarum TaxID=2711215 RepID=A0A6G6Y3F2_9SPHN|nr:sulfite exporter TauE/SafE family protein [Sphingosinithalassobacter tenebrarum]QIG79474.1 sulfite exporter TauE/SafE family protein [Sphingosinithalassobacter tenebrarum]